MIDSRDDAFCINLPMTSMVDCSTVLIAKIVIALITASVPGCIEDASIKTVPHMCHSGAYLSRRPQKQGFSHD